MSAAARNPAAPALSEEAWSSRLTALEARVEKLSSAQAHTGRSDGLAIIVFSSDIDRLLAAFHLATAGAAMGLPVTMFFTFWGLCALKERSVFSGKNALERLLTLVLPSASVNRRTSRLNLLGFGPCLFGFRMRRCGASDLRELMRLARELGVRMVACESSMRVMGVDKSEFGERVEYGGAASFLDTALDSRISLFV